MQKRLLIQLFLLLFAFSSAIAQQSTTKKTTDASTGATTENYKQVKKAPVPKDTVQTKDKKAAAPVKGKKTNGKVSRPKN